MEGCSLGNRENKTNNLTIGEEDMKYVVDNEMAAMAVRIYARLTNKIISDNQIMRMRDAIEAVLERLYRPKNATVQQNPLTNSDQLQVGEIYQTIECKKIKIVSLAESHPIVLYWIEDAPKPCWGKPSFIMESSIINHIEDKRDMVEENAQVGDGWIEWRGGNCPVESTQEIDIKFRNGSVWHDTIAGEWNWGHNCEVHNIKEIVAYRIVQEPKEEEIIPVSYKASTLKKILGAFNSKSVDLPQTEDEFFKWLNEEEKEPKKQTLIEWLSTQDLKIANFYQPFTILKYISKYFEYLEEK